MSAKTPIISAKQSNLEKIYTAATLNLYVAAHVTLCKKDYLMPQQKVYKNHEVSQKHSLLH